MEINSLINENMVTLIGEYFEKKRLEKIQPNGKPISQKTVSLETGISNAEISRVESKAKNSGNMYTILTLCKYYQVSEEEVLRFYREVMGRTLTSSDDIVEILLQIIDERNAIIKSQSSKIDELIKTINGRNE